MWLRLILFEDKVFRPTGDVPQEFVDTGQIGSDVGDDDRPGRFDADDFALPTDQFLDLGSDRIDVVLAD